jgi:hypothetical protein
MGLLSPDDYDRQAAEEICINARFNSAWLLTSQAFAIGWSVPFRGFCPHYREAGKSGNAKEKPMFRNFKVLLFALAIIVIAGGAYAFAATNTVQDTAAGYKANVVPGYTVTDIVYDLNAADPSLIDAITFSISPSSGSEKALVVYVQTATGGAWTSCTLVDATLLPARNVTCTYGALTVESVTALNIVASSTLNP